MRASRLVNKFNGKSGRKPQTEARRWVYGVIAYLLDSDHERSENGWFSMGEEATTADRVRLNKALDAVRDEMLRKAKR